jgi:hypothetical protein
MDRATKIELPDDSGLQDMIDGARLVVSRGSEALARKTLSDMTDFVALYLQARKEARAWMESKWDEILGPNLSGSEGAA